MSAPGDFGINEKKPLPDFQDFCSRTLCDYAVVHAGIWNIRQLVKIYLSGSQRMKICAALLPSVGSCGRLSHCTRKVHRLHS